jgi:hypothetical protein
VRLTGIVRFGLGCFSGPNTNADFFLAARRGVTVAMFSWSEVFFATDIVFMSIDDTEGTEFTVNQEILTTNGRNQIQTVTAPEGTLYCIM